MDARNISDRLSSLKREIQDVKGLYRNRLDDPRSDYKARCERLHKIKLELAEMLYEFKQPGTD